MEMDVSFKQLADESGLHNDSFIDPNVTQSVIPLNQLKTDDLPFKETSHKKMKSVTFQNDQLMFNTKHRNNQSTTTNYLQVPNGPELKQIQSEKKEEVKRSSLMHKSFNMINAMKQKISQSLSGGAAQQSESKYAIQLDQSSSQLDQSHLNESQELEKLKNQLPENIVMLMLQPKRDIDFDDMNEIPDDNQKLRNMIGSNDYSIDEERLKMAIANEDQDMKVYLQNTVDIKIKNSDKLGCCIFSYKSRFRMYMDFLVILFAIYNSFMIPLEVAYSGQFFDEETKGYLEYAEYSIDAIFSLDILISFRTTYLDINRGEEIKSGKMIARRYIKSGMFFMDLAATVPFDTVVEAILQGRRFKQLSLLGLIKMTRMIRLRKIIAFMNVNQSLKVSLRMVQLILFLLLILHGVACFWYLIVIQAIADGDGEWYPPMDQENQIESPFYEENAAFQYMVTFYYAVLILIGRANEMAPVDLSQTVYCGFILILGSFVSTFIFGSIATVMENATQKDSLLTQRMNLIQSTMAQIKLPLEIQDNILQYLMQVEQAPQVQYDLQEFLQSLSPALNSQVTQYLHNKVLRSLDELSKISEIEINFIAANLKTMLVMPSDVIIQQGNNGDKMYFIINGRVQIHITQSVIKEEELDDSPQSPLQSPKKVQSPTSRRKSLAASQLQINIQQISIDESKDEADKKEKDNDILSTPGGTKRKGNKSSDSSRSNSKRTGLKEKVLSAFKKNKTNDIPADAPKRKRYLVQENIDVAILEEGSYFGEIALFSILKRTSTVTAKDYCTFSYLTKDTVNVIKNDHPQIFVNFKKNLKTYNDQQMVLRRQMIRNIPYFKNISDDLVNELILYLRETKHDKGSIIVKHGDLSDRINIIWQGQLSVEIFYNGKDHQFETLNTGGCFCVFSAFSDDYTQIFDFKAIQKQAVIISLKTQDLLDLSKANLELADILKLLDVQIKKHQKTDFDFFRFISVHPHFENEEYRRQLRLKFKYTLRKIARDLISKAQVMTEPLTVVQQICKERKLREEQLRMLMFKRDKYRVKDHPQTHMVDRPRLSQNLQLSMSSYDKPSEYSSQSSYASSMSGKLGKFIRTEEDLIQEEKLIFGMNEQQIKQKRKLMIKNILNPLEVPGIDIHIFKRIDGLPKDQNMYTEAMIEQYENLKSRIEKQQQTKENIQFLNRLIFKQNTEIYELRNAYKKQIADFEMRMAALTQQIRKKRNQEQEMQKIVKTEKKLKIERFVEQQRKEEFFKEQYFQSFGQPYNSQISIKNQVNNYIVVQDDGTLSTKFTKVQKEFNPPSKPKPLHQYQDSLSKEQLHEKPMEETEASPGLEGNQVITTSQLNYTTDEKSLITKSKKEKTPKKGKSRPKSHLRQGPQQQIITQDLQGQINDYGGRKVNSKREMRKKRHLSQLVDQALDPITDMDTHKKRDLSETLSKAETIAMQQSKALVTPQSQDRLKSLSRGGFTRSKIKKKIILNQESSSQMPSAFLDEGGEGLIKDSSKVSVTEMGGTLFDSIPEQRNIQGQSTQALPHSKTLKQGSLQMMPQPPRPQTRGQSRMQKPVDEGRLFLNYNSCLGSKAFIQQPTPMSMINQSTTTYKQQSQPRKKKSRRQRHSSVIDQDPNQLSLEELKTEDMLNFDFYNQDQVTVTSYNTNNMTFVIPKRKRTKSPINRQNPEFKPQIRFKETQKKENAISGLGISVKSPMNSKQVKMSEHDKKMWEFYRNLIHNSK